KEIAEKLKIPFTLIDCRKEYKETVLSYFRNEYRDGKTPNPCIYCNAYIKFGVLPSVAKKAGIDFEKFATGHYGRISFDEKSGLYQLKRAKDLKKDQTYFLYRLDQKILSQTLFPLASFTKEQTRKIAKEIGLKVADKPDSQDFYCGNYNGILNFKVQTGDIVDKDGKVLGKHGGFWNYTIGQRRGLGISSKEPLYVTKLLPKQNIVEVGGRDDLFSDSFIGNKVSWCSIEPPEKPIFCSVKIRQQHKEAEAEIAYNKADDTVRVKFKEPQSAITPGQSAVFYQDDIVLGGAIINL
ncbi:MAG: tRNA 2-thiouridine(34) synthase MnmA, partial [Elusimicrobiota bacterium]|nr:tRNA 2-thiouridine(34) synthase MnmA [Elusimicrobiota bacterium]